MISNTSSNRNQSRDRELWSDLGLRSYLEAFPKTRLKLFLSPPKVTTEMEIRLLTANDAKPDGACTWKPYKNDPASFADSAEEHQNRKTAGELSFPGGQEGFHRAYRTAELRG